MKGGFWRRFLKNLYSYFLFFLLVAFLVTCTTMLFVTVMSESLNLVPDRESIKDAAKVTFLNVIILSTLFALIDYVRRKLTTERVTKQIAEATARYVRGDFSVRIKHKSSLGTDDNLNEIISSLNTMAEELSGVETLRGDFISNVSHEMKTPLSVIASYARLLSLDGITDEQRREYTQAIMRATKRLSDMMTNILKLNRLENQRIYPTYKSFNLSELLLESILAYEDEIDRRNIALTLEVGEDIYICSDSELISLIISNLISNAIKFTEAGGSISVSLTEADGGAEISVSDTGCGMSAEVGARIFEKFYQGDTSHSTEGNGLGLALVKRVVDILGADISVNSTLGVGSTFTVRLFGGDNL
ncbi:MAG: HAMP domain-containing histidine kinase [Clostridia bacterium]|nr:HAMP domain-containing histidine kinase [Clostridia bacterium]